MCLALLDVFNTECHPFKAPAPMYQYGSGGMPVPTSTDTSKPFVINQGALPIVSAVPQLVQLGLQTLNQVLNL